MRSLLVCLCEWPQQRQLYRPVHPFLEAFPRLMFAFSSGSISGRVFVQ